MAGLGGDKAGAESEISVTLTAVKERELPKADDAFAQMASEFDTIKDLKADIEKQLREAKVYNQGLEARDKLTDLLLDKITVAVSDELVEADVNRHLEGEGRLEDKEHRAEVTVQSEKSFKVQMILDEIALAENVKVNEQELMQYLIQASQSYGMDPNEFIKVIDQNGQIPSFVAEVARRKALSIALENTEVSDSKGKVDISTFTSSDAPMADEHAGHDHN